MLGNPSFRQIFNKNVFTKFSKRISIKIGPNNVFVPCLIIKEKKLYIQLLQENVV